MGTNIFIHEIGNDNNEYASNVNLDVNPVSFTEVEGGNFNWFT